MEIEGTVLAGPVFDPIEGRVVIANGEITAVEEVSTDSTDLIVPAFVNTHTHIGDSIAKEAGAGLSLDELVAPPDGLKHRLLRAADREELLAAMGHTARYMQTGGIGTFVDFREGDVPGVKLFEEATRGLAIDALALGRESIEAMRESDGYGASGANDADFEREREATRRASKRFAIHAGERDATDIDVAIDLDPDFLVHMVYADEPHLDRIEAGEIPVVVCPRSNLVTGVGLPPVEALCERTTVALGTDNVMSNSPSMFREMEFAAKLFDLSAREVLGMATHAGATIAGRSRGTIEEGREAKLLVLDGDSDNLADARDPVRAVVRRAGIGDVKHVLL